MTETLSRDARLAAAKGRRADWTPMAAPVLTGPVCSVARCERRTESDEIAAAHAGRCAAHWSPLRGVVATMAGAERIESVSRRLFSEAMSTTEMTAAEWADLSGRDAEEPEVAAILDRATRSLYLAGWFVAVGPRGGHYLRHRTI